MFFPDLSEYDYYSKRPFRGVKTVGWIDNAHPFQTGVIPHDVLEKLKTVMLGNEKINIHVNAIRGVHPCNLCGESDFYDSDLRIGSTEIWISDGENGFYAAPSMIIHYITDHQYLPPEEFLDALREFDLFCEFNAQAEYEKLAAEVMSAE